VFLLASSAQTSATVHGCRLHYDARACFHLVAGGLVQRSVQRSTPVCDGHFTTRPECSAGLRNLEALRGLAAPLPIIGGIGPL